MKETYLVTSKVADRRIIFDKVDSVAGTVARSGDLSAFSTIDLCNINHHIKETFPNGISAPKVKKKFASIKNSNESDTKSLHKSIQSACDREKEVLANQSIHESVIPDYESEKKNSLLKKMTYSLKEMYEVSTVSTKLESLSNKECEKQGIPGTCKQSAKKLGENQAITLGVMKKDADTSNKPRDNKVPGKDGSSSLLHAALQHQSHLNTDTHGISSTRGKCLTVPSTENSNSGLDNVEGNLIVYENDLIRVLPSEIHMHKSKQDLPNCADQDKYEMSGFQVLELLGQGTFAQVFKCRCIATGNLVALKIVKNKDAYTRQAAVEIDIFQALARDIPRRNSLDNLTYETKEHHTNKESDLMVEMICYFMYKSHLCLVFELLGKNLYEVLKRRQFRGLPIGIVRRLLTQALEGINELSQRSIVHCDVKPENILVVSDDAIQDMVNAGEIGNLTSKSPNEKYNKSESKFSDDLQRGKEIKIIDFGSASFEGETAHTYIQSRFYRSPEVLVGVDYDSAIDMWSLGCVAAELFLGLPILPGVHEHDQISRICEMIGQIPEWMLDQGLKSEKYFVRRVGKREHKSGTPSFLPISHTLSKSQDCHSDSKQDCWRLKTREEFINSLSSEEREQYGGLSKYEQQPTNRYFKRKSLEDIVMLHGSCNSREEKEQVVLFAHLLRGILNPDPCERWTAFQASSHPFITGNTSRLRKKRSDESVNTGKTCKDNATAQVAWDIHWKTPFDSTICRRKLTLKDIKKGVSSSLESSFSTSNAVSSDTEHSRLCLSSFNTTRVSDLTGAMSLSNSHLHTRHETPPPMVGVISGSSRPFQVESLPYTLQSPTSNYISAAPSGLQYQHPVHLPSHHQLASSMSHINGHFESSEMRSSSILSDPYNVADVNAEHSNTIVPRYPIILGAQSYSGAHYDRINHVPPEGELGYALQRPGVVPNGHIAHISPMILHQHPSTIIDSQQPHGVSYIGQPTNLTSPAMTHFSPSNGQPVGGIHCLVPSSSRHEMGCTHNAIPANPGHDVRITVPQDMSPYHMQQYSSLQQQEVSYNTRINEYDTPPNLVYYTGPIL